MAATATQRAKCTIHVSSLPAETTKDLLMAAFIPFGEIVDIQIPLNEDGIYFCQCTNYKTDIVDNSLRGFAYIEFEEAADAEEAIFNMNDSELYGRVIKVDVAKPHKGAAGLDPSLPGMSALLSVLIDSLETRGMDQSECQCRWEWNWTGSRSNAGAGDDFTGIMMALICAIPKG
jgi:RNA recognition motif-containing protein